jgi:hypothetical protein
MTTNNKNVGQAKHVLMGMMGVLANFVWQI